MLLNLTNTGKLKLSYTIEKRNGVVKRIPVQPYLFLFVRLVFPSRLIGFSLIFPIGGVKIGKESKVICRKDMAVLR